MFAEVLGLAFNAACTRLPATGDMGLTGLLMCAHSITLSVVRATPRTSQSHSGHVGKRLACVPVSDEKVLYHTKMTAHRRY